MNKNLKSSMRKSDPFFKINNRLTDNDFKSLFLSDYIGVFAFITIGLTINALIFII